MPPINVVRQKIRPSFSLSGDILLHLVYKGFINPSMLDKIHGMRGFQNIVVYRYGNIDDALAFHLLKENITDFFLFNAEIERVLEKYQ